MTDTIYVLVPLEITVTDGGTNQYHLSHPVKMYEIENMIRAGYSFKTFQEAINRLNKDNIDNPLRIRYPNPATISNKYPKSRCKICGRTLGSGLIKYHAEIGAMHTECWMTK